MLFGRMDFRDSMAVCAIVVKDDDCEMSNLTTGPLPLALLLVLMTGAAAAMAGTVSSVVAAVSSTAVSSAGLGSFSTAVSSAGVGSTAAGESTSEEEEDIGGN